MDDIKKQHLFVVIILIYIFINLNIYTGKLPLFGEEHRRSIVAQEMILTGDYITPKILQAPYFNKPPLHNWFIALASGFKEVTRFSARFVSVFAFMVVAFSMYLFMLKMKREYALTAFLIISTNYLMQCEYGNMAEPDMLLTMFTFLSFIFYFLNPTNFINIFISAIFMGAGILTKGLSPIFFYPGIILYLIRNDVQRTKRIAYLALHFIISLILPVLWVYLYYYHGDAIYLLRNFTNQVSSRADKSFWDFLVHLFYFPSRFLVIMLPWSAALLFAFKKNENKDELYQISLYIFVISLIIFTILPGSRDRYLMPAYPFFAIAAAYHIDSLKILSYKFQSGFFIFLAACAVSVAIFFFMQQHYIHIAIFLLLAAVCAWLTRIKFKIVHFAAAFALILLTFYEHGLYYYRTYDRHDYRPDAVTLVENMSEPLPVIVGERLNLRTGLYLERLLNRPVYKRGVKDFDKYYYISSPYDIDSTAVEIFKISYPEKPQRSLKLQYVDKNMVSDNLKPGKN